jgi:hypothetical protein
MEAESTLKPVTSDIAVFRHSGSFVQFDDRRSFSPSPSSDISGPGQRTVSSSSFSTCSSSPIDVYQPHGTHREDDTTMRRELVSMERMFFDRLAVGTPKHNPRLQVSWSELQGRLGPAIQAGYLSLETTEYASSVCQSISVLASSIAQSEEEANRCFLSFSDNVERVFGEACQQPLNSPGEVFPGSLGLGSVSSPPSSASSVYGHSSPGPSPSAAGHPYSDSCSACTGSLVGPVRSSRHRPSKASSYSSACRASSPRSSNGSWPGTTPVLRPHSPTNADVTYDYWRHWFLDHFAHPYPDNDQKAHLLSKVPSLTKNQVSFGF